MINFNCGVCRTPCKFDTDMPEYVCRKCGTKYVVSGQRVISADASDASPGDRRNELLARLLKLDQQEEDVKQKKKDSKAAYNETLKNLADDKKDVIEKLEMLGD